MSDSLVLNWAIMAVSFFNTILLLWLGTTVLLNAERKVWGIWVAGGGLLMGGLFFVSHTAIQGLFVGGHVVSGYTTIISQGLLGIGRSMIFWWTAGLVPAIVLPFAWYVIILWYGGFWSRPESRLYQRQRRWFWATVCLTAMGLLGLATGILLLAIPSQELLSLRVFIRWSVAGIPLMALAYSGFVVLCIALSLDALRRPGPTLRVMGAQARQRARPWLTAASLVLLLVSMLVAGLLLWVVQSTRETLLHEFYAQAAETLAAFDLLVAAILGMAILLLGQAIVSYEVFTGKTLPRRGLQRHWGRAVFLAAGYSVVIGGTIAVELRPLYSLLLTAMLMTFFFALSSWRSFVERERYIESLRPFVSSQRIYDQILTQETTGEPDIASPFYSVCETLLGTRSAHLIPVGPLAPLVAPLAYGNGAGETPENLSELLNTFTSPSVTHVPLDPAINNGLIWAIPLWSQRGLTGILLLGEKQAGGLYSQEEIEIARISGERLIDTQASAVLAQRLMRLQRARLAQTQVFDQSTRRVLHDEILPALHAAMLSLSDQGATAEEVLSILSQAHRQVSDLLHEMPTVTAPEVVRLGLVKALQRVVNDELSAAFDQVTWSVAPDAAEMVSAIPTLTAEVIFYAAREAVRNAAQHGRKRDSEQPFCLQVRMAWNHGLEVVIEDNGVGFGGSANHGGGHGLALHSTMMAVVGGTLAAESLPGEFTRVTLALPYEHLA